MLQPEIKFVDEQIKRRKTGYTGLKNFLENFPQKKFKSQKKILNFFFRKFRGKNFRNSRF